MEGVLFRKVGIFVRHFLIESFLTCNTENMFIIIQPVKEQYPLLKESTIKPAGEYTARRDRCSPGTVRGDRLFQGTVFRGDRSVGTVPYTSYQVPLTVWYVEEIASYGSHLVRYRYVAEKDRFRPYQVA